ncbi:ClpXP protease specificity-enhancing factor [Castellaniella caeni]|uniref:ClpXP protease specificity-enhancing factor n=1 Tax=Castellaniella caeni TaxID=266123 RepID=UPI00082AB2D1|nr:ClpXP protease specificity-enhancing factor [Castellaniella caeni]
MQETSTKPYLIRALHEWCTDNGYTPYLVVTVDSNTVVPAAHVHDGQITLNISHLATNRLTLGNEYIEFESRFNGVVEHLFVPVAAVSAVYARETGAGMGFEVVASQPYPGGDDAETGAPPASVASTTDDTPEPPKPSHLKIVK